MSTKTKVTKQVVKASKTAKVAPTAVVKNTTTVKTNTVKVAPTNVVTAKTSAPKKVGKQVDPKWAAKKQKLQARAEAAVRILTTAVESNLSMSEASRRNNEGRNFLSQVKSSIKEDYESKFVTREVYSNFKSLLKAYDKM